MRAASRIGSVFGMDPIVVLNEPRSLHRAVREAAWQVFIADQEAFFAGGGDG